VLKIVIRLFNAPPAMFIRRGSAKSSALESLSFNRESVGNIEHLLSPFEKAGRGATVMARLSVLDRERSVAHPGYSRWLVPPAALAIHLCIGQVYAFSVFKIPLTQLLGVTKSTPEDWKQTQIAWVFSLAIVMLVFPLPHSVNSSKARVPEKPCSHRPFVSRWASTSLTSA
jgi:hypothetical protein